MFGICRGCVDGEPEEDFPGADELTQERNQKLMNRKDAKELSEQQRMLADLYASGVKPSQAAVAAGYSPNSVRSSVNVMTTPKMAEYIREERRRQAEDERMGREELVAWLVRVIRREVPGQGIDGDVVEMELLEQGAGQRLWKRQKMVNKLKAAKRLAKIMGWSTGAALEEEGEDDSMQRAYEAIIERRRELEAAE